jgi:23S rRNA (cytidine1920-2'-O)/16S rRNA (cytidine1409-2'-O)-methyltransferase
MAERLRLDLALVRRGLAETRERAQSLILAGAVRVDGQPATKPSQNVPSDAAVAVVQETLPYVSRGGVKLAAALNSWQIDPTGLVALDVGASTGGFTDVLLQRGAARVYAVDVGYGQLHYRLRTDPRVVVLERTNVRYLEALPEQPYLAVADVSFISLRLALPPVFALLHPRAPLVALVKPQFEAGRQQVGRGGVVRDPAVRQAVLTHLAAWSASQPWRLVDAIPSPILGQAGNVEFLSLWRRGEEPAGAEVVERAIAHSAHVPAGPR